MLRAGEDVEPELLDAVSTLGSGTRVIGVYTQRWAEPGGDLLVYLHGVEDPGNVGTIIRSAHALADATGGARAGLRGPLLAEGGAGVDGLDLRAAAGPRASSPRSARGRSRSTRRRSATSPSVELAPPLVLVPRSRARRAPGWPAEARADPGGRRLAQRRHGGHGRRSTSRANRMAADA